jgi:regulator of sirC expression with transglutaminase-like and TPR domain
MREIDAVVTLLCDDSDRETQELVLEQLLSMPERDLRAIRETCKQTAPERAGSIEPALYRRIWQRQIRELPTLNTSDLQSCMIFLAQFANADLRPHEVKARLSSLAEYTRAQFKEDDAVGIKIDALVSVLAELHQFRGNQQDYYDPRNSFIDQVLERKLGIPISLSAVYLLVGWKAGLPMFGVGLPGHFIVGVSTGKGTASYLDPFRHGARLTPLECEQLVAQCGYNFEPGMLRPVSNEYIFGRALENLLQIYHKVGDNPRRDAIGAMRTMVTGNLLV